MIDYTTISVSQVQSAYHHFFQKNPIYLLENNKDNNIIYDLFVCSMGRLSWV